MSGDANPECPFTRRECAECANAFMRIWQRGDYVAAEPCDCDRPCLVCRDTGHLAVRDARGYVAVKSCRRQQLDERVKLVNAAKLPGRYHAADFVSFQPVTPSLMTARHHAFRFASEFVTGAKGLLFHGACGTGKTHLMVAVLRYLVLQRSVAVRFVEFFHLLSALKATFEGTGQASEVMRELIEVPVLAVDELGKGRGSEWEREVIDELVSRRYNARRTTMFTTNFAPGEKSEPGLNLKERVGVRIYSRLKQMCAPYHLSAPDYRTRDRE